MSYMKSASRSKENAMTDNWTVHHVDHVTHRASVTDARSWHDADRQAATCDCDAHDHQVRRNGRRV